MTTKLTLKNLADVKANEGEEKGVGHSAVELRQKQMCLYRNVNEKK